MERSCSYDTTLAAISTDRGDPLDVGAPEPMPVLPVGTERIARKLSDALPGGDSPLRTAVWEFMRPMLSPTLASLNRDTFINDHSDETTVDLDQHRSAS